MYNHPNVRPFFRTRLWGYPDLITKLFEEVRPVLVEEREKRREDEKEEPPVPATQVIPYPIVTAESWSKMQQ